MMKIGNGGYSGMRPDAGEEVLKEGVDYLFMDYLSEGSVANHRHEMNRGGPGFAKETFGNVMRSFLPLAAESGTTIITNAGAADPTVAGIFARDIAEEQNVDLEVTVIEGTDCRDIIKKNYEDIEFADEVSLDKMVSAEALIGAEETIKALENADNDGEVHLVIGPRIADPSLVVTPIAYEFDIELDDWDTLGQAMVVGHLMENDGHATGGYYMEPERKPVPDPHLLGFPIAEVHDPETSIITKPKDSGGLVSESVLQEQMFYEVHDPANYMQADVTADFTNVDLTEVGEDSVKVTGGTGTRRPDTVKVLVGQKEGYRTGGYATYGGPNAESLARLAGDIIKKRIFEVRDLDKNEVELLVDVVGVDALFGSASKISVNFDSEVMIRACARVPDEETAKIVKKEIDDGYLSPLGPHCGAAGPDIPTTEIVGINWCFLPRETITNQTQYNKIRNY
jgi:hypothetical protein